LFVSLVPERDPDAARRLRIISGSDSAADVTVVFRNKFGAVLGTQQTRVPGNGTLDLPVNLVSGFSEEAFAEVRSAAPITARMEVSVATDPWALDGQPAPAASKLVQPHTEWNGIFSTRLTLTNTSDQNRTVTFQLHAPSGPPAAPNVVQLMQKNSVATFAVESLFGIQSDTARGAGWIEIDTGGQVLVNALAVDARTGAAAASPVQAAGGGIWSMPFFVENAGYFTGLALANPGDTPVTVDITAYDPAGRVLGQVSALLGAKQNRAQLVSQWIAGLPADSTGQIVITAGGEISLLAYFGTDDGASLAAIPFTPVRQ
jgi:hypothetical protein